jgi:hypothetical protein
MTAIHSTRSAQAFHRALRECVDIMGGAIETDDADLLVDAVGQIVTYTAPLGSDQKSTTILLAILGDTMPSTLIAAAVRTLPDDHPIMVIDRRLLAELMADSIDGLDLAAHGFEPAQVARIDQIIAAGRGDR